jgi:glucokinase
MILAGDIGGTKTHLALMNGKQVVYDEKFKSRDYSNLNDIVHHFLEKTGEKVERACFGIAGPIRDGRCQATNLPWVVDAKELGREMKTNVVFLLNDLEANAYGIRTLNAQELYTLNEGAQDSVGNQVLISAGTGLGEAGLYWDGKMHHPFPCEGGHSDFAPRNELEMELLRWMHKIYGGHVSYERALSGPGLHHLYLFLTEMRLETPDEEGFEDVDPPKAITERALNNQSKACVRALRWFVSLYGGEAGNLALKMLSLGGVFIGGGIAPKILPFLKERDFMRAFCDKGRFAKLLSQIPIKVILNENTALLGAAYYAQEKG